MTIVDIARESGYSVSTVSRVLNNRRDVSPETKERIMEIVNAYNFVPNNNAKQLKQTSMKNILVLVKGTSNMLFASIIEEIQKAMADSPYEVNVSYLDEVENEVAAAIRMCRERKPLGILFLGAYVEWFYESFSELNVPCCIVTNQGEEMGYENLSSVSTDDEKAAEIAVDYLIEQGHKNIAEIGGDIKLSSTSIQRHAGLMNSFKKHNMVFDEELYYEQSRYAFDSAYRATNRLLDKNIPLTAIFAMSDTMAIGAVRAIRDRGLNVPEDISVIGFDGTTLADYYNPKIATIKQEYEEIAKRSVEVILRMIDQNQGATHELIPFTLQKGESVRRIVEE